MFDFWQECFNFSLIKYGSDSYHTSIYGVLTSQLGFLWLQVRTFEMHCGSLSQYGMKHMRSIANICNVGITQEAMNEVSAQACISIPSVPYSFLHRGYSAWWYHMAILLFSMLLQLVFFHGLLGECKYGLWKYNLVCEKTLFVHDPAWRTPSKHVL